MILDERGRSSFAELQADLTRHGVNFALILVAAGTPGAHTSHAAEIKSCPGTTINESDLEALRQKLHVVEADHPAYIAEARAVANALHRGLAEAPTASAWCDAAFRLYGPAGRLIPDLIHREPQKP